MAGVPDHHHSFIARKPNADSQAQKDKEQEGLDQGIQADDEDHLGGAGWRLGCAVLAGMGDLTSEETADEA